MVDPLLLTVLAFGHILSAVGWLGGGLLLAFVIGPGLQRLSAPSRLEFTAKVIPKLLRYLGGMIGGTFIFGLLLLYFEVGGNFALLSPSTTFGATLSAGIGLAVVTAIFNIAVPYPAFTRMASIAEGMLKGPQQAPPPELMKYGRRARFGSLVATVLLLLALVMMVTAGFY